MLSTVFVGCSSTATESEAEITPAQSPSDAARDRLEKQGIIYAAEDWETTTGRICDTDKPDLYMGISDADSKYQGTLTSGEKTNVSLYASQGGEAPNAGILTDREKQMVIDVVTDDVCDIFPPPTATKTSTQSPRLSRLATTTASVPDDFTKVDATNACTDRIVEMYQPDGIPPTYRLRGDIEEQNGGWYMEGIVVWHSGEEPSDFECIAKPGNPPKAYPVVEDYRAINKIGELLREGQ